MSPNFKKYKDNGTGKTILEVYDLSFLREKDHPYGWAKTHLMHLSIKTALLNTDKIYVKDALIGIDLVRYYFVPKEKIVIDITLKLPSDKA